MSSVESQGKYIYRLSGEPHYDNNELIFGLCVVLGDYLDAHSYRTNSANDESIEREAEQNTTGYCAELESCDVAI